MKRRMIVNACSLLLAFSLCVPAAAWADDDLGDVDSPRASTTTSSGTASGASSAATNSSSTATSVDTSNVVLSSTNDAALIDGCDFAVDEFSRAQVGSNREVNGAYSGYCYYIGGSSGSMSLLASSDFVVVYVPADQASSLGVDLNDQQDCADLKSYLSALDNLNANGGEAISAQARWYFTEQQTFSAEGLTFGFDRELKSGQFYDSIIGADGSDITDTDNPLYTKFTHACFSHLVAADAVGIVAQPSAWEQLTSFLSSVDYSPLWVTLKTTGTAIIFIFILGLAAAYFSLRIGPRAQDVADAIFTIPMVLPPTVCGFLLLLALGRNTAVGSWFISIGFPLIFSWPATVIAAVVVAFPLMYRSARGAFEGLDSNMLDAARTLGWSNRRVFFKLMLPLSWSNIASGTVLAFARALGEFGATLFLAGNYLGVTRTIPIAIYFEWMNGNTNVAIFWTIIIMIFSFVVILFINLYSRHTTRYRKGAIDS